MCAGLQLGDIVEVEELASNLDMVGTLVRGFPSLAALVRAWLVLIVVVGQGPAVLEAQGPAGESPPALISPQPPPVVIRAQTNLVLVRVVVRDGHGNPVGGLSRSDFQLLDDGKPQTITYFSAESGQPVSPPERATGTGGALEPAPALGSTKRYTALFFDDYHLQFADLRRVRKAISWESSLPQASRS